MLASAAVVVSLAVVPAGADAAPSAAYDSPDTVLARGLADSQSLAVGSDWVFYTEQATTSRLSRVRPGDRPRALVRSKAVIDGLSVHRGRVVYGVNRAGSAELRRRDPDGDVHSLASISDHEQATNPDGSTVYGVLGIPGGCKSQWPDSAGKPLYTGTTASYIAATTYTLRATYVVDRDANSVLKVDRDGSVRTVTVFPPVLVPITQAWADAAGLPSCLVGLVDLAEAAPTDVELGSDGLLHVSLSVRPFADTPDPVGMVVSVRPGNGEILTEVTGLHSPQELAVDADGNTYVVGGRDDGVVLRSTPSRPTARPFLHIPHVAGLEVKGNSLYATSHTDDPDRARLGIWRL